MDEAGQDRRNITACQGGERPAVAREDAVITTGVFGSQDAQNAEQVGNCTSAQGEDRRQGKEDETPMHRPRERRLKGIEDRVNLLGKLIVNPLEPPPCDTGFAYLLTPHGTKSLP